MVHSHATVRITAFAMLVAIFTALTLVGCAASSSMSSSAGSTASDESSTTSSAATDESSSAGTTSTSSTSSSASTSASSAVSSASSTSPTGQTKTIGSPKVGYMQVPSTWVDRISDMDPRIVDSYGMVYYVDPDSEYTSAAQESFAFSRAVQMTVAPTSYTDIASQVVDTFKNNAIFGETTTEDISLNGHKATLIATSIPDDNLAMLTIVIDRDGDGRTAVSLAMNCGPLNGNSHEEVLAAASTWTNQQ